MQQVDKLIKSGDFTGAEAMLDQLIAKLGLPATGSSPAPQPAQASAQPSAREGLVCDPHAPMTVSTEVTVDQDCAIGGDLTVKGDAVLHFDYRRHRDGHVVVSGNVIVRDNATLWVEGAPDSRAVFVVDNELSQQHSMTSSQNAKIKLTSG